MASPTTALTAAMTLVQSRPPPSISQDTMRELHGRTFSSINKTYMLPTDDKEFDRLSLQHFMLRTLVGGLLPLPKDVVDGLLDRDDAAVLDVGSGSGHWAVDIAQQYSHVRVVGFDLVPARPASTPDNCTFVQGDAHRDLAPFAGTFDIVHCRAMATGSVDFAHVVREMTRCLRPGGLLMLAGGDLGLYTTGGARASGTESHFARLLLKVRAADERRGVRARSADFATFLAAQPGVSKPPSYRAFYCPIGWPGDGDLEREDGEFLGAMMLRNAQTFAPAWRPLLLNQGHPRASVEEWIKRAEDELRTPASKKLYTKWHYSWVYKDGSGDT